MRNALLLGACFLLQLIAGECSAPGDEDELCTVTSTKTRIVAPEYEPYVRPLMDTRYYKKLLESGGRWQSISVDGDRYTWGPGTGGQCQRVMRGCTHRFNTDLRQQLNYAVSQYIRTDGAKEVMMDITFGFFCSPPRCSRNFDVLVYETSEERGAEDFSNYKSLLTVESQDTRLHTISNHRLFLPNSTGFYLALKDTGTCVSVSRLAVYGYRCPKKLSNLVQYPESNAPPDNSPPIMVNGECSEHSSQQNGMILHPSLFCGNKGMWLNESSCECDPGFWYAATKGVCLPCPLHTYKTNYGNGQQQEVCIPCPKHSVSVKGATECECKPTFYRTRDEGPETDCTTPPSVPLELTIDECTNTTISISWKPPSNTGERPLDDLFYQVIYQKADSLHLGFNRATSNLGVTSYTVTGLDPLTDYKVWVVSENSVSEEFLDSEEDMMLRSTVVDAKTKAGVPEKITVFTKKHGNTFSWQPPKVTNGNMTGFDLRVYYKDYVEQAVLIPLDELDFCYSPLTSELPPEVPDGVLYVQVRAKTAQGPGPWSDEIQFERPDNLLDDPTVTVTVPNECPIVTCDPPVVCPTIVCEPPEPPVVVEHPDKINEITSYGDLAAWQPLEGEVEYYNVRAYYRNSIGGRKGTKMRNLNRPWVKLLNDFAGDLVRGLDYYIQVRARNSAGAGPWSDELRVYFNF